MRKPYMYDDLSVKSLGQRIRAKRESEGVSQAAMARALDITRQSYAAIENGQRKRISALELAMIAQTLRMSTDAILGVVSLPPLHDTYKDTYVLSDLPDTSDYPDVDVYAVWLQVLMVTGSSHCIARLCYFGRLDDKAAWQQIQFGVNETSERLRCEGWDMYGASNNSYFADVIQAHQATQHDLIRAILLKHSKGKKKHD